MSAKCYVCKEPATVRCEWGLYEPAGVPRKEPMNVATMCSACSDELWQKMKASVNLGQSHWVNRKLEVDGV